MIRGPYDNLPTPAAAAGRLITPTLTTIAFTIDLKWAKVPFDHFYLKIMPWIYNFASIASKTNHKFRRIEIVYNPWRPYLCRGSKEQRHFIYPWHTLKWFQSKLEALGIECSYTEPYFTEETFYKKERYADVFGYNGHFEHDMSAGETLFTVGLDLQQTAPELAVGWDWHV
ncbi:hypothetical protein BT63DRAFT_261362 [Microthyrium microscopicum]|uniref:Uncharacterized protein n=1 Tax=Microthyrium microscopicum TaxID=703497 RepID=A0A6A6UDJ2_9PEZI|nr:hypothetical protein BT63DRAFT_261362 [Microthyrium microscopicum]